MTISTTYAAAGEALARAARSAERARLDREIERAEMELICAEYIDNTARMILERDRWSARLAELRRQREAL